LTGIIQSSRAFRWERSLRRPHVAAAEQTPFRRVCREPVRCLRRRRPSGRRVEMHCSARDRSRWTHALRRACVCMSQRAAGHRACAMVVPRGLRLRPLLRPPRRSLISMRSGGRSLSEAMGTPFCNHPQAQSPEAHSPTRRSRRDRRDHAVRALSRPRPAAHSRDHLVECARSSRPRFPS